MSHFCEWTVPCVLRRCFVNEVPAICRLARLCGGYSYPRPSDLWPNDLWPSSRWFCGGVVVGRPGSNCPLRAVTHDLFIDPWPSDLVTPGLTAHWLSVAATRAATVGATSRQLVMTAGNSVRASSTLQLGAALGVSSHFTAAAAEVERRRWQRLRSTETTTTRRTSNKFL